MLEVLAGLDAWTALLVAATAGLYASTLVAAGASLFRLVLVDHPALERGTGCRRIIVVAAGLAVVLTLLQAPLQAGFLAGGTLAGALDPALLAAVVDTGQGPRIALLLAGLLLLHGALAGPRHARLGQAASTLGVVLILAAYTQVGHTAGGEPRGLLAALLMLHLGAVAFWVGALIPLYRLVRRPADRPQAARTLVRFGQVASGVVAALVAAAAALAWLLIGGWPAWPPGAYAQAIGLKLALLLLLLACAATNRWWLVPAFQRADPKAAARLRASIALEGMLVFGILLVTALLTTTTPPR
jgi:putative copper resistance protein D